jgi:hypothetical protein
MALGRSTCVRDAAQIVANFTGSAMRSMQDLSADYERGSDACPQAQKDGGVSILQTAPPRFGQRRGFDIISHYDARQVQPITNTFMERKLFPAWHVWGQQHTVGQNDSRTDDSCGQASTPGCIICADDERAHRGYCSLDSLLRALLRIGFQPGLLQETTLAIRCCKGNLGAPEVKCGDEIAFLAMMMS